MLRRARKHFHEHVEEDIEIMPLMNLFVALIPMLLISAVFLEVAVMRMQVPSDAPSDPPPAESLALAVEIREDAWIVTGRDLAPVSVVRADPDAGERLRSALASAVAVRPGERDVTIASQPGTQYQDIVSVMDIARAAGLPGVALTRTAGGTP